MARGVNKVILVGNVGKEPEIQSFDNKKASFPLATSETYRDKDGKEIQNTEWHNIVAWRGLADIVEQFVRKGSQLYLEGKIKTRSYESKEGVKKYITEIVADSIILLGKRDSSDNSDDNFSENQKHNSPDIDIPF